MRTESWLGQKSSWMQKTKEGRRQSSGYGRLMGVQGLGWIWFVLSHEKARDRFWISRVQGLGWVWVVLSLWSMSLLVWGCSDTSNGCDTNRPCKSPLICVGGKCEAKRCTIDTNCSVNETCDTVTSRCVARNQPTWECRTDRECRPGEICEAGLCRLPGTELTGQEPVIPDKDPNACVPECRTGFLCKQGQCIPTETETPCKFDSDCQTGRKCNLRVDLCQNPCTSDTTCQGGKTCVQGFCQQTTAPECDANKPCTAPKTCESGKCVEPECHDQKPCTTPKICENGKCVEPECHDQKPCIVPKLCRNQKCEDPPSACGPAQPCPTDKKCYKSQCVSLDYCESDQECTEVVPCVKNRCGYCDKNSDCYSFQGCQNNKCVTQEKKIGEPCKASTECVKNAICAGDAKGNSLCRKPCDPLSANPGCDAADGCGLLGTTLTGACFPKVGAGALGVGGNCNAPNQDKCEVNLTCVNQGNGSSVCMQYCNRNSPTCPNNGACLSVGQDPVGVCEIKGGSGNVQPGQTCTSDGQCISGAACVTSGGGAHQLDICMTLCNPKSPSCPRGAPCVGTSNPSVGVCQVPCSKASDCASGFCLGAAGSGTCTTGCDPYQAVCTQDQTCDVVPDPNGALRGVCGPEPSPGLLIGDVCLVGAFACKLGLVCISVTRNTQGNLVGYCGLPCLPGSTRCPTGTACKRSVADMVGGIALTGCIP